MAYTTGTLTYIAGGPIEGAWKLWEYTTTDTLAQLTAARYITDASFKGMSLGDFVIVANQTNPQGYILQVQNLTAGTMSVSGTPPSPLRPASAAPSWHCRATSSTAATSPPIRGSAAPASRESPAPSPTRRIVSLPSAAPRPRSRCRS